jgi:hypothetical protein
VEEEMTPTYLIGKHLRVAESSDVETCEMCGQRFPCLLKKKVIGNSFMDTAYLVGNTGWVCVHCAACIGYETPRPEFIKNFSFVATESELLKLKREDLWQAVLNPPKEPFVFGVTYSHKKHISFKATVNPGGSPFVVSLENGECEVYLDLHVKLLEIVQKWYSPAEPGKPKTWFTKADIQGGCSNFARIEKYGINEYLRENAYLEKYRNTLLIGLLAHAVNSGEKEND